MIDRKRIFVYSENEPVDQNVVAHGLNRAASPILRSIKDHLDGIAIYPMGPPFPRQDLDPELAQLCTSLPRFPTILTKVVRKVPVVGMGIADSASARLLAPVIRNSSSDTILCFVGANIRTLARSAKLAAFAHKAYAFYVVDDFLAPLRLATDEKKVIQRATLAAGEALRGASHVFTITDGLGKLLSESYGVSPTTLPLAFEPSTRPTPPPKNQIIFVGSINFLYSDGLLDLIKAIQQIRDSTGSDLTLRLTVPAGVASRELGELPSFVLSAPVEAAEGLASEIACSLFAFLPYSFDPKHFSMVSTSFPSKSMEYLSYARSIVVYGPDYGVSTQYFRGAGLPSVVASQSDLEGLIRKQISLRSDFSPLYREYLETAHSLGAARKTLCRDLGLEEDR